MNKVRQTALAMASLSIYRGILNRAVPKTFYRLLWSAAPQSSLQDFLNAWGAFFSALCEHGGCENFSRCMTEPLLYDENAFSLAAASKMDLPRSAAEAAERDIAVLCAAAALTPEDVLRDCGFAEAEGLGLPRWRTGAALSFLAGDAHESAERLRELYARSGCGIYARHRAFIWREGKIRPVVHPDPITLADLKGYELQRGMAIDNTAAFLGGLPANNCLLYGDRGTGKSSTVKALLNEYGDRGLRMIEIPKDSLCDFPILVDKIAAVPMKFIIFIDDLSFSREDDTYASLKAVLEGGLAARPENALIYATSNRRHLVRETFSDREGDEIHRGDTIQESLSLADRFGLSIRFTLPDKKEFLQIVRRLAEQRGLDADPHMLEAGAEKWAISRGGRSPRCAKQYIRAAEARLKSGGRLDAI